MGVFRFKEFSVDDSGCGMKICSDSVLLGVWFLEQHPGAQRIADIGAGSGVLSLLAAQICPDADITAVEIVPEAARAARLNFIASPYSSRLRVEECDFVQWSPVSDFNLIISNPPYFTTGEHSADAARCAARHQQGLTYESLLRSSKQLLSDGGRLGFVSPADFERDIIYAAEMAGLKLRRLMRVRTSPRKAPTRLLWDFSTADGPVETAEMSVRNTDGSYSAAYLDIVAKYYLKI